MNFLCFDTEDDSKELMTAGKSGFGKRVTQIAAITAEGKRYYNKGDVAAFLQWLQRQPEKYIYALNLQYDLGNLFSKKLDVLDCTMVGGRLIKASWGNKIFVDVFNIWPMSVQKLGECFGLEKLGTDSMATDKAYVFRDVEIIRKAMLFAWHFCDHLGLKHLPPTLGGLCIKVWKHWEGINVHDSSVLTRDALFGGRVELFKTNDDSGCIGWTDINSLYPFVMMRKFPGVMEPYNKRKMPEYGIVKATVSVKQNDLVVLPFRSETGRIFYPWGKFTGTWTIAELREATLHGTKIEKVFEVMGTNEGIKPYGTFVERLYKARLESNSEAEKLFFKLLMNNLYGRLGTSGVIGRSVWQTEKNRYDGIPYGEKVLVQYQMPLSEETNWSHAAYVTAYGRLELLKYMRLIGGRLIYTDTDATIFDCPGLDKSRAALPFKTGDALGAMKVVQRCSKCGREWHSRNPCPGAKPLDWWTSCQTWAPKMYRANKVYKAKGVPKKFARQFIETGRAEFDLPFKLREALRFYDRKNIRRLSVWRRVEKVNRQHYDRKVLKKNIFSPCKVNSG